MPVLLPALRLPEWVCLSVVVGNFASLCLDSPSQHLQKQKQKQKQKKIITVGYALH
jgi:hypothetical protein